VKSSRDTIVSHIIRLDLSYDGPARDAPASVILKIAHPNYASRLWIAGRQEVAFYTEVAPLMSAHLIPRCFEGSWNAETHAWHLLLEDLTDSHRIATAWPLPPSFEHSKLIVRALAAAHAEWWDNPRLGNSVGAWLDTAGTNQIMQQFAEHFGRFADQAGDRLPDERRDLYDRLIDAAPRLTQRYHSRRNVTIAHGDAHVWNFLLPQEEARDDVRLFDFDQWRINVGSGDLAYMMALQWYPDRRRLIERPLLDCYHETLLARGVRGYDAAHSMKIIAGQCCGTSPSRCGNGRPAFRRSYGGIIWSGFSWRLMISVAASCWIDIPLVMAGLDPAIHLLRKCV
jgi:hypothetical protein